jgi:hypothetical protein
MFRTVLHCILAEVPFLIRGKYRGMGVSVGFIKRELDTLLFRIIICTVPGSFYICTLNWRRI